MSETPPKPGRPTVDDSHRKRNRAISLSDVQYQQLQADAAAQKLNVSAYVIKKLKLS